jgi:3-phosphoshikimate 1-carboxyvinyltransferase
LVLAALAKGPSRLKGALDADDSRLMAASLEQLGTRVETNSTHWDVHPGPVVAGGDIQIGLAGTVMRFLPPVAALAAGPVRFDGSTAAGARPIRPLLEALGRLGVNISLPAGSGSLPFTVTGTGQLTGGHTTLDARLSSQFLSALLLAAPAYSQGLSISLEPAVLPSRPHVEMTLAALATFGANGAETSPYAWTIQPGGLTGKTIQVEPDLSNAAPFLAAAVVAGGTIRIPNWPAQTTQPGALLPQFLTAFGARTSLRDGTLELTSPGLLPDSGDDLDAPGWTPNQRHPDQAPAGPICLDLSAAGELAPCLTALGALSGVPFELTGIAHLRGHETDRLAALATEIARLGGSAEQTTTGLRLSPAPLSGTLLQTYGDHRMAQFGAIIGLAIPGVELDDVSVTAKTLPSFTNLWEQLWPR